MINMASYDIIGSIAVIKSFKSKESKQKLQEAKKLLKPPIKTVVEKTTSIKGRLRTFKTRHLCGEKNLVIIHKENNCLFKLDIEKCYFSPRQANERKQIALNIKKNDEVLVMFSGIGCYPIVIYKIAKPKQITTIEISKSCNYYAKENLILNKIPRDKIKLIQGNVKNKMPKKKFDIIVMVRPNLKKTFLQQALKASKKNTKIFYQGFCREDELENLKQNLIEESEKLKRKIKIIKAVKAGEIAPYKFRWRIEIKVLR